MKKLLVLVMLALSICANCFANESDIVNSFRAVVMPKIQPIEASYNGVVPVIKYYEATKYSPAYYQKLEEVLDYKIDVIKTDSLVYPYRGVVKISKIVYSYGKVNTPEEAKQMRGGLTDYSWKANIYYNYDNGNWVADYYDYKGFVTLNKIKGDDIYGEFYFDKRYLE